MSSVTPTAPMGASINTTNPITSTAYSLLLFLPKFTLHLLSFSINIRLSFSTIITCLLLLLLSGIGIVRYKVLTSYSKLKEDPLEATKDEEPTFIRDDLNSDNKKRYGSGSYLDEFLIALKIFGYLEKNVFNELVKNMKTVRIQADDVFVMDDNIGFVIVVEGNVQIYSKIASADNSLQGRGRSLSFVAEEQGNLDFDNGYDYDEGGLVEDDLLLDFHNSKYQLLNEVKTGNPLSSLVDILSLFTNEEELQSQFNSPKFMHNNSKPNNSRFRNNSDIAPLNLDDTIAASSTSPEPSFGTNPHTNQSNNNNISISPETIAKTTTNSTIAIIPADSFRKLRKYHPKSSAHIVQMILTRFYRSTFQTAHSYLGLTKEIFETEIKLNKEVKINFPKSLYEGVIKKFKENALLRAKQHDSNTNVNDSPSSTTTNGVPNGVTSLSSSPIIGAVNGINNRPNGSRGRISHNPSNANISSMERENSSSPSNIKSGAGVKGSGGSGHNPGDVLSKYSLKNRNTNDFLLKSKPKPGQLTRNPSSNKCETQEYHLKISLIKGMFKFIGIDEESFMVDSNNLRSSAVSGMNSPAPFVVYQQERQQSSNDVKNRNSGNRSNSNKKSRTFSTTSSKFEFPDFQDSETDIEDEEEMGFDYNDILSQFAENIDFLQVEPGTTLLQQSYNTEQNGLYYVVSGRLEVAYTDSSTGKEKLVYVVKPGGAAGYLSCFFGSKSMVSVKVPEDCKDCFVGYLSNKRMEMLCEKYFMIYLNIAKSLIRSLSPKLLKLDSAIEWIQLDAGETLFKQDTDANGIYIMLNGRLRSFYENPETNQIKILNEYGQGQTFGEVEVLTAAKRSSTFVALRDSEAARIPRTYFEILALENPSIMIKVSRIVANTIKQEGQLNNDFNSTQYNPINMKIPTPENPTIPKSLNQSNYRTITILPTRSGLPVTEFAIRLIQAFKNVNKSVIGLDQVSTLSHLGRYAFDKISRLKQSGFFSDLEENFDIVVYIADTAINSNWTTTCIQQGDCVLLLADAVGDPKIGDYERLLLKTRSTVRTELIFLHPERYVEPGLVSKWLKNRVWVDSHHHIKFNIFRSKEGQLMNRGYRNRIKVQINQLFPQLLNNPNLNNLTETLRNQVDLILKPRHGFIDQSSVILPHKNDFMRLARILSNQAVAVVLGGGGARGFSHLGVLRALEENGIPIDLVGGTSIGSFIGGLYAKEYDLVPIYGRTKKFAQRVGSIWRNLFDLTIPVTSYTTGHEFNRGIWKVFGESRIEDFWLNYYCNSTNITNSCMEVHTKGYAWRFIRASMSLAGLLPPITDKGSMLLDGGYVDNLPVDEMKKRGASIVFAVDVGSVDDRSPMNYGDSLSGFWIFVNRWNPFSSEPNIPTMSEIQLRLCYVSSVNALDRVKKTPGIIYLRPPIENYATLDFAKFEEIYNVGSIYGDMVLKELIQNDELKNIAGIHDIKERPNMAQRRNSI